MFKWSKRRPSGEPSTPKLASISLPDDTSAKTLSRARWKADLIPQAPSTFLRTAPEYRSKDRHPVASGPPPTIQGTEKSTRIRKSSTISQAEDRRAAKLAAHDIDAGYFSSRDDYLPKEKASSKSSKPIKGILKPPKPFMEQDFNKPLKPSPPPPHKGGPFGFDEVGCAGSNTTKMKGGGNFHRSSDEKHSMENTSQNAAQSRYKPLAPPVLPGGYSSGASAAVPVYPAHAPVIPNRGPYYAAPPSRSSGPFAAPQIPPQAPTNHRRSSRYGEDRGGGVSDTEGVLTRGPRPSRRDGAQSDTEGISRTHSSRYGGVAPQDLHRALHQVAQQQPAAHGHEYSGRPRGATYPLYQGNHGAPPTNHFQVAEDYSRSRNQSFNGYAAPAQPRGPPSSSYVRPHIINKVPQKEEAIAISWPLLEPSKRRRLRPPRPPLFFDIAFDPTEHDPRYGIRALADFGFTRAMTQEEMDTPASSHCVVREMIITCEERELGRWKVVARRAEGLRCIDVFQAIYETYHVPLTPPEIAELSDYVRSCIPAFIQRCKDTPGLELKHQQRGMCRVDLLRTKKLFKGMTRRNGVWILEVEKPRTQA